MPAPSVEGAVEGAATMAKEAAQSVEGAVEEAGSMGKEAAQSVEGAATKAEEAVHPKEAPPEEEHH
jgi:hypothetical protein